MKVELLAGWMVDMMAVMSAEKTAVEMDQRKVVSWVDVMDDS